MSEQTDVIVVGVGTGGEEIAGRLAMAGLEVVGIEPELVGGECAYWACLPTKAMVRAANLIAEARRIEGFAGQAEVTPDWGLVAGRVREQITGDWDDGPAVQRFEKRGGRFIRGRGRLIGARTVVVDEHEITARRAIVISTGSKPVIPPIPGLENIDYWTSRDVIKAEELPRSLAVLGGGTVGCELGQVLSRFGVEVTIIDIGERLLSHEEPEAGEVVQSAFEAEGIEVRTGARVVRVSSDRGSIRAHLDNGAEVSADRLLVATGRAPDLEGLGLEEAGVKTSDGRIEVDASMRATDGIWAMGDVTSPAMFTHLAMHQAPVVESAIRGRPLPAADQAPMAAVTFTDPEVGSVGMRERDARSAGIEVAVTVKELPATFRGFLHGPGSRGIVKLVADRSSGLLLGATAVGPCGGEVMGMLNTAIHARIPIDRLRRMIYAFPTFHGGVGEAIGAYARALTEVIDPDAEVLLDPTG